MKDFDKGRLKAMLAVFFLALALPTAALIGQAYSQLKWEAFHQYRGLATDLTGRIDAQLIDMIRIADSRSFADYSFLNVTGDTRYNFVQRSPLAAFPVAADVPGVLGYFQVDASGAFSTPLLPTAGANAEQLGIGNAEYNHRLQLAQQIQAVLADHSLVQSKTEDLLRRSLATATPEVEAAPEETREDDSLEAPGSRSRQYALNPPADVPDEELALLRSTVAELAAGAYLDEATTDEDAADDFAPAQVSGSFTAENVYSQQVFDLLKQQREDTPVDTTQTQTKELDDTQDSTTDNR